MPRQPSKTQDVNYDNESGNAFLMILIAVVLLAGLMFTFTRSARQGGTNMSDRQAAIAVTDVMAFAQRAQRAVDRAMRKSISEVDLSFETRVLEGYENTNCTVEKCKIFNVAGGGLTYNKPQKQWFDSEKSTEDKYGDWIFTARNTVTGAGNDCADASCVDLLVVLPFLKENMCLKLNDAVGVENPSDQPPKASGGIDLTLFDGTYLIGDTIQDNSGDPLGQNVCVRIDSGAFAGSYHFYSVIKPR